MKKFFELRMKNGRSFIASTNNEGFCQFYLDGFRFSISSDKNEHHDLTFTVEKYLVQAEEKPYFQAHHNMEVVSLREVVIKKNASVKIFIKDLIGISTKKTNVARAFLKWKENIYFAKDGGIDATTGMIYSQLDYNGQ